MGGRSKYNRLTHFQDNLLDLRRVDVHFHQLVVASLILWLILLISRCGQ